MPRVESLAIPTARRDVLQLHERVRFAFDGVRSSTPTHPVWATSTRPASELLRIAEQGYPEALELLGVPA